MMVQFHVGSRVEVFVPMEFDWLNTRLQNEVVEVRLLSSVLEQLSSIGMSRDL